MKNHTLNTASTKYNNKLKNIRVPLRHGDFFRLFPVQILQMSLWLNKLRVYFMCKYKYKYDDEFRMTYKVISHKIPYIIYHNLSNTK